MNFALLMAIFLISFFYFHVYYSEFEKLSETDKDIFKIIFNKKISSRRISDNLIISIADSCKVSVEEIPIYPKSLVGSANKYDILFKSAEHNNMIRFLNKLRPYFFSFDKVDVSDDNAINISYRPDIDYDGGFYIDDENWGIKILNSMVNSKDYDLQKKMKVKILNVDKDYIIIEYNRYRYTLVKA